MAHKDWNSIDHDKNEFDYVYCAFLDILGYKNKSEEFFQNNFNLFARVERALETTQKILSITSKIMDIKDIDVSFFSDSIIITTKQKTNSLFHLLHYSSILAAHLGFEGLFIRGGISEGKHFKAKTKTGSEFLASEALQKAYLLECKSAIFPRILIDVSLIPKMSFEEKKLVVSEGNEYIVHYAPLLINEKGNNENDVYSEMEDILEYMKHAGSTNVMEKYQWILDYYYWTMTQCKNFNLANFKKFQSNKSHNFKKLL